MSAGKNTFATAAELPLEQPLSSRRMLKTDSARRLAKQLDTLAEGT